MINKIIEEIVNSNYRVIAIDGRCASGKTTICKKLQEKINCEVIHLDDFFLRSSQQTKERLLEVGGNIDYERFEQEVLIKIKSNEPFSYQPYNCTRNAYDESLYIENNRILIIEGSYSHHPRFVNYYDYLVFLTVDKQVQLERLEKRNKKLLLRFITEWIPKEETYFNQFKILEKANMVIDSSKIN